MDPSATFTNNEVHPSNDEILQNEHHNNTSQYALQDLEKQIRERNSHGRRKIAINFTPSWFSVNMGTGIVSTLLYNLPYNGRWLYWISVVIFCLNIVLFFAFLAISIIRYTMFKGIFMFTMRHPVQSLFAGTFPMGLATIINMIVYVCVPAWGTWAINLAWTLWWIDVVISVATCFYLPFLIMSNHKSDLSSMTAAWLLPIVSTIVASGTGGIVAEVLPNPKHALWTVIISYILWGTGFPLAMVALVMYFHRLTIHHLPPREVIVSVFLPLGSLGQGSFTLMQLGKVALRIFPITGTLEPDSGRFFYNFGNYAALIIWGYGLVWLFFAIASISQSRFPFNMGWWGFTFPLGVYTVTTITLAKNLPSEFLKVLGTIFSMMVVLLWLMVSLKTLQKVVTGKLFFAPCVKEYEAHLAKKTAGLSTIEENGEV